MVKLPKVRLTALKNVKKVELFVGFGLVMVIIVSGLVWLKQRSSASGSSKGFSLISSTIKDGRLSEQNTCSGNDLNPAFDIKGVPSTAKSLAIIGENADLSREEKGLPNNNLWLVFNIPITTAQITEGIRPPGTITRNFKGNFNYNGPCPDKGKSSDVTFTLYALDKDQVSINSSASVNDFQKAIKGHIVAKSVLKASYIRPK